MIGEVVQSPIFAQVINGLTQNNGQDFDQDLQLGAIVSALAPVAMNAIVSAIKGQQEDLGFSLGGSFKTPWGGAGGNLGWNQDEEDLQLGALFSALAPVAINALAGAIKGQQEDLGFSLGGSFKTPWGGAGGNLGWNQ